MRRSFRFFVSSLFFATISTSSIAADEMPVAKKMAALSDFGVKLDTLEQAVDDIAFSAALALLKPEYPDWKFRRGAGFDGIDAGVSDDIGAVAGDYDYAMGKLRGAIFRNAAASDDQRERALAIFGEVKDFISAGYAFQKLIEEGDMAKAGAFYQDSIFGPAENLNLRINELTKEIDQAIKFSAL